MLRRCEPLPDDVQKVRLAHAGMRSEHDLRPVPLCELAYGCHIVGEHRFEGVLGLPFRVLRCQRMQTVEGKHGLGVKWMLYLQRAVLIECSNTVFRGYEAVARRVGDRTNEIQNRLLGWAFIPGRKGSRRLKCQ